MEGGFTLYSTIPNKTCAVPLKKLFADFGYFLVPLKKLFGSAGNPDPAKKNFLGGAAGAAEKVAVPQAPRGEKPPRAVWELQRRRRCSAGNHANEAQKREGHWHMRH